jgi:hypothetical protein
MSAGTNRLTGPHIKVERAKEHARQLQSEIEAFLARKPYQLIVESDPDSGDNIYRVKVSEQPPARWGTIIGDVVHNLRTALDYLAYLLVVANGHTPGKDTYFPICNSKETFEAVGLKRMIKDASPEAKRRIASLRPYREGNKTLWVIHELDISDKHHLLVTVGSALKNVTLTVTFTGEMALSRGEIKFPPYPLIPEDRLYPLEDGAEVFRFKTGGPSARSSEVAEQFDPSFDVAFGAELVVQGKLVIPTITELIKATEELLDVFEHGYF